MFRRQAVAFTLVTFLSRPLLAGIALPVPDDGWRLWPDTRASWKDDRLFLPDEAVDPAKLPVNEPTGGWSVLSPERGIPVTLPSTVEQHFWGEFGLRPYTPAEYEYAPAAPGEPQRKALDAHKVDAAPLNGNYLGVSWWWRPLEIPASFRGKRVLLQIRGARQRAEVYVNRQFVGYDMVAETSFECDVTKALRAGEKNELAIRITNPGGRLDWIDYETLSWGKYVFHAGHGFGGLDRGMTLRAVDPVYVDDHWVLNTPEPHTVTPHATVRNTTASPVRATVRFEVLRPGTADVLASASAALDVPAGASADAGAKLSCPDAALWEMSDPHLYQLRTTLATANAASKDDVVRPFGFRWLEPRTPQIDPNTRDVGLFFNGRRIRLLTAISWNFWGLNGLWPTPELADKEVRAAKRLNLNMLNFHRDVGREDVFARQDELGLLRYMEPGGGGLYFPKVPKGVTRHGPYDTTGQGGAPRSFSERYMEERVSRVVRQFRSHPSLALYVLQNETEPDLADPRLYHLLRRVHELDPSRVVAAKSGISVNSQAWFPPCAEDPLTDDGTGVSGWRDRHSVGGAGVWQDNLYRGPDKFTHQMDAHDEIVDWGEMLGAAVADNHPLMLEQIRQRGGKSYDLADHAAAADAYSEFLQRKGFAGCYPTEADFYRDLGNKEYEFWARVIETARLSEGNDILTISGWESTAIDNHSGLVDNLRNFHGDPDLLAPHLAPVLPVIATRSSVITAGNGAPFDLYFLNESGHPVAGKLKLTLTDPQGHTSDVGTFDLPAYQPNRFAYPLRSELATAPLELEGRYTLEAFVDGTQIRNTRSLLAIRDASERVPAAKIGVTGDDAEAVLAKLSTFRKLKAEPFRSDQHYDAVVLATAVVPKRKPAMDTGAPAARTPTPEVEPPPPLSDFALAAIGSGTPLLILAGDEPHGRAVARQLAAAGAFRYLGSVPTARAPWMGNWVLPRTHPLFAGLPTNAVAKGDYQLHVSSCYGLQIAGPNVETLTLFGRDHSPELGTTTFTARLGPTPLVFQGLTGMHPVIERRWLSNALAYLLAPSSQR